MATTTLDFNFEIKTLEGKPVAENPSSTVPYPANKILAHALANASTGDALKYWFWSQSLYDGNTLTLDPSDIKTLESFINTLQLQNYIKAALLNVIGNAKSNDSKP